MSDPGCTRDGAGAAISFVIPVRNDAERLQRCLSSIGANAQSGEATEIVVLDNGSIDGSGDVARSAGAIVLRLPDLRVGELRNHGAAAASGEVLAFVDADHEIAADWVPSVLGTLRADPAIGAVGALCEAPRDGTWVQRTYDLLRRRPRGRRQVSWLGSGNMAVRREAFQRVGGFDTRLETCEDVDLCRRLRAAGCAIVEDSRLRNVHLGDPATLREVFYGELWRGRDNLRASLRPPIALRDLLSAAIPVAHLALLLTAIAGTIAGTRLGITIAIGALAAVVLLVSLRAIRMVVQSDRHTMRTWAQALSVALTYDLARALAIVHGATHAARTGHG